MTDKPKQIDQSNWMDWFIALSIASMESDNQMFMTALSFYYT